MATNICSSLADHNASKYDLTTPVMIGSLVVCQMSKKEASKLPAFICDSSLKDDEQLFVVHDIESKQVVAYCPITSEEAIRNGAMLKSAKYFSCDNLVKKHPGLRFFEAGMMHIVDAVRSHRAKALLWNAITNYCQSNNIDCVIGCYSFNGKYPAALALELSYLHHFCKADESDLHVKAHRGVTMDMMPEEAIKPDKAFKHLPPFLRYCLRLGAKVGDGVVVDNARNMINVFMMLPARTLSHINI